MSIHATEKYNIKCSYLSGQDVFEILKVIVRA